MFSQIKKRFLARQIKLEKCVGGRRIFGSKYPWHIKTGEGTLLCSSEICLKLCERPLLEYYCTVRFCSEKHRRDSDIMVDRHC